MTEQPKYALAKSIMRSSLAQCLLTVGIGVLFWWLSGSELFLWAAGGCAIGTAAARKT